MCMCENVSVFLLLFGVVISEIAYICEKKKKKMKYIYVRTYTFSAFTYSSILLGNSMLRISIYISIYTFIFFFILYAYCKISTILQRIFKINIIQRHKQRQHTRTHMYVHKYFWFSFFAYVCVGIWYVLIMIWIFGFCFVSHKSHSLSK